MPDETFSLPAGFRFGVAVGGFQVEGGYNGPGQPENNWAAWERSGRVVPAGRALDLWNRYEDALDRAVGAGCDTFRFSVEWARCEPAEGEIDSDAFARYAAILDSCHERGLEPVVALHHFTHPNWLGDDFWLALDSPERFAWWAATVAERLGSGCRRWLTINEPNAYAFQTYFNGALPPGRVLRTAEVVRCLGHLLTAHVLAYEEIHRCQPDAEVSFNNHAASVYELDRLLIDVVLAPSAGVDRESLASWLAERRAAYYSVLPSPNRRERTVRAVAASILPLDQALPRAVGAVYGSVQRQPLDSVQLDYYNPVVSDRLRAPGHRTAGGRAWRPFREHWDDPVHPEGLFTYCRANQHPDLPLVVAENGLCNRVKGGIAFPRSDGWDRVRFLRANLVAVVAAIDAGVPVSGYYHWTLADNYEWGSYEHRFGLYGVDHHGTGRWSDLDSFGGDAAATYRRLIEGLRAGDRSVLR